MSMIGLFTAGTHAANATTATDDPAAASGFGVALRGALDALTGAADTSVEPAPAAPVEELPTESDSLLGDFVLSSASPVVVTPTAVPLLEMSATAPLVELVETPPADQLLASTTAVPLVEPGATPVPNDAPASVGGAVGSGTPAVYRMPASTTSTSAVPLPVATAPISSDLPATSSASASNTPPIVVAQAAAAAAVPTLHGPADSVISAAPVDGAESATESTVPAPLPATRPADAPTGAAPLPQPLDSRVANPASASTNRTNAATSASVPASARGPVENAAQVPTVVAAQSSAPAPLVTPAAPVAAPSPAASAPLATQLARPIFSLAAAGTGQHVMTVSVTPDNLGPVTLRAHVGADGVRVELFAPNDIGRDAIRAIIPELRRDLAGAGLGGNLTLSSQNQPSAGSDHSAAGHPGAGRGDGTAAPATAGNSDGANDIESAESSRPRSFGSASTIDVLA